MPPKCILASRPRALGAVIGPQGCKVKARNSPLQKHLKAKQVPLFKPLTSQQSRELQNKELLPGFMVYIKNIPVPCEYDSGWSLPTIGISRDFYKKNFAPTKSDGTKDMSLYTNNIYNLLFKDDVEFEIEGNRHVLRDVYFSISNRSDNVAITGPLIVKKMEETLNRKIKFKV